MYRIATVCVTVTALLCVISALLMLIWCRSLAPRRISSGLVHVWFVLSLVLHRYASSCQDKLEPSKDHDVILALIIAAASSKHRDTPRMGVLKQGIQVLQARA